MTVHHATAGVRSPLHKLMFHDVTGDARAAVEASAIAVGIRSGFIGRSETIPVVGGRMELGEFGRICFVDFDGMRPRDRTVHFTVIGE